MKYILFLGFLAGCYTASLAQNKVQPTTDIRVAIANTEMNVLYMGYTNRVSVGASGLTDSMYVSCEGCTFISGSDEKGIYNVKVSRTATDVLIRIYDKTISDAPVATEVFRVQPLPRPRVYISGMSPFASSVEKNRLTDATLQVELVGSPLDISSSVTGGTLTVMVKGTSTSFEFFGNKLPELPLDYIETDSKIMIESRVLLGGVPVIPAVVVYSVY